MIRAYTFLIRFAVALLLVIAAQAANRITATVTVTNYPASGDFLTINGSARQWSNVFNATSIGTNVVLAANGTNLYRHLITNGPAGPVYVTQTSPTNVSLLGNVGQAMAVTASGTWASIGFSTQVVAVAKDVRVPFSVETATNATNIASQLVSDLSTHSTNAFASGSIALSNYAGTRLPNAFTHSNHFLGSNVFTGSNTLIGPTLVSRGTITNLYSHGGALTNAGGNVFAGSSTIGTVTITNGIIVSGTLSNATLYIPTNTMADVDIYTNGFMLIALTNGMVVPTNIVSDVQVSTFSSLSSTIGLGAAAYPIYFRAAPFSGIRHDLFLSAETNAFGLVSSNNVLALISPSRIVLSNASFMSAVKLTNATTLSADPVSSVDMVAASGEWIYRASAASEGAGQNNRVHNRAGEVNGSGTDYTLTASTAQVDFGGTDPDINTLPSAGTYLVTAIVTATAGGTANDTYNFKLRNVTGAADISGSAQSVTDAPASTKFQVVIQSIVTVTGADRIQLFGHNSTAARGTVNSTETKLTYVRLH